MLLFKGSTCYTDDGFVVKDVQIEGIFISKNATLFSLFSDFKTTSSESKTVSSECKTVSSDCKTTSSEYKTVSSECKIIDAKDLIVIPGFLDVHVHLREPGFFYKESIATGTLAGLSAGYTGLCSMPNLNPVPDNLENLAIQQNIIEKTAHISVFPYASISIGQKGEQLSDMESLAPHVLAFSDDGRGVQSESLMREAMYRAKALDKIIVAHCEDNTLLDGGYVHDGKYCKEHGLRGISSESEWKQIERDLKLVEETGCRYHICHISTKEGVQLVREAKAKRLRVTCETAPHYLVLCDEDIEDDGRFKMNPPLRGSDDRDALVDGLCDGTIDVIATDHAPHSDEEKSKGLRGSAMGVVGLECAFPVLYTKLVLSKKLDLHRLIEAMSVAPRKIFGIRGGTVGEGEIADLAVLDLNAKWTIKGRDFLSKGSSTPFEGMEVQAKNMYTILSGDIIWKNQEEN